MAAQSSEELRKTPRGGFRGSAIPGKLSGFFWVSRVESDSRVSAFSRFLE